MKTFYHCENFSGIFNWLAQRSKPDLDHENVEIFPCGSPQSESKMEEADEHDSKQRRKKFFIFSLMLNRPSFHRIEGKWRLKREPERLRNEKKY